MYGQAGIQYHVRRHVLGLGGGVRYLYGAQGNIRVYTQDQVTQSSQLQRDYAWLKTDGLNTWQYYGRLQYGYMLTPQLSVQGGASIQLSPIEKEDQVLSDQGYYWSGDQSRFSPFVQLQFRFYGTR